MRIFPGRVFGGNDDALVNRLFQLYRQASVRERSSSNSAPVFFYCVVKMIKPIGVCLMISTGALM